MRTLYPKFIPGTNIFYVNACVPHTATIIKADYINNIYQIENKSFITQYESKIDSIDLDSCKCIHTSEIYLPEYQSESMIRYYLSATRSTSNMSKLYDILPKRSLYRKNVDVRSPFIEFEYGMLFKFINDENLYFYDNSEPIASLVDVVDASNVIIPIWNDHDLRVIPIKNNSNKYVSENDIEYIYTFNIYMGECRYNNVHTPVDKYWNLIYNRNK